MTHRGCVQKLATKVAMNCPATMTEMSTDMMSSSSANGAQVASVCAKTVITMGTDGTDNACAYFAPSVKASICPPEHVPAPTSSLSFLHPRLWPPCVCVTACGAACILCITPFVLCFIDVCCPDVGASTVTTGGCTPKGYCQAQETMIKVAVAMGEALGADASDMPKVKSCSECSGDNCNAAGGLRTGAWIALLASAATLLAFHN